MRHAILILAMIAAGGCSTAGNRTPARISDTSAAVDPGPVVHPADGLTVRTGQRLVEIEAFTCLDAGWLELVACSPDTREHESLVVIEVLPSDVHAGLLLAGFEPGTPGRWQWKADRLHLTPPSGDRLRIFVRYERDGQPIEEPVSDWIADARGVAEFPDNPWVFGGSLFIENPPVMGPGEHYAADLEGSIIGLVTFGDEVIGFEQVFAHDSAVQAPEWKVAVDRVPPPGTWVTLVIRPAAPSDPVVPGAPGG